MSMSAVTTADLEKDDLAKPPSPATIKSHIDSASHQKTNSKAFLILLMVASLYGVSLVACAIPVWWLQLVAIPLNGLAIGMLFVIGHDACHSCYSETRGSNLWIARLVLLPPLWRYECWKLLHNYYHHRYTCLRDFDCVWQPLSLEEYRALPKWRRGLERFYKSYLGVMANWLIEYWWKHCIVPRKKNQPFLEKKKAESRLDVSLISGFLVFLCSGAVCIRYFWLGEVTLVGVLSALVTTVVLPFLIWSFLVGLVVLVQHTHPKTVWFKNKEEWSFFAGSVQGTVHFRFPFPLNKLLLDVMEHNAHHVDTNIPVYRLLDPQKRLEQSYPEDITVEDFSFATMRRIFQTCQLYDYDRHCWLSFDGEPTTSPINFTPMGVRIRA